jgi:hypothetical protein
VDLPGTTPRSTGIYVFLFAASTAPLGSDHACGQLSSDATPADCAAFGRRPEKKTIYRTVMEESRANKPTMFTPADLHDDQVGGDIT